MYKTKNKYTQYTKIYVETLDKGKNHKATNLQDMIEIQRKGIDYKDSAKQSIHPLGF